MSRLCLMQIQAALDLTHGLYASRDLQVILSEVSNRLSKVHGPYAFAYYSRALGCILYGRDPFGRRSLISVTQRGRLVALTSVVCTATTVTSQLQWQRSLMYLSVRQADSGYGDGRGRRLTV